MPTLRLVTRVLGLPQLLAEAEKKRYERRRQERERFGATADRLSCELRSLSSGVEKTAYHEAKGIEPLPGAPVRNGDLLVPGYDVEGKLWTIRYIKEDGTKRFARESRKHDCFHVVGAADSAEGLHKLANSSVHRRSARSGAERIYDGRRDHEVFGNRVSSVMSRFYGRTNQGSTDSKYHGTIVILIASNESSDRRSLLEYPHPGGNQPC